jgi:hypothetical protein
MSGEDPGHESFEEMVRRIAHEVSQSVERMAEVDLDGLASAVGVDPDRARRWVETAGQWLHEQAGSPGDIFNFPGADRSDAPPAADQPRGAGPHPLDTPTAAQGRALAALDSGRWTVEPGSNVLMSHGEGPDPDDAFELVGELRARDWIAADGTVTLVGRHALSRWLDAATPGESI